MSTGLAIDEIASAIFDRPVRQVVEAYSDYDQEPREFTTPSELAESIRVKLAGMDRRALFYVIYPDMEGQAIRRLIRLDPRRVSGFTFRYTWSGWGLISINITNETGPNDRSSIISSSEKRALAWESTMPELPPASAWNWSAVQGHTRRLKRALLRSRNATTGAAGRG